MQPLVFPLVIYHGGSGSTYEQAFTYQGTSDDVTRLARGRNRRRHQRPRAPAIGTCEGACEPEHGHPPQTSGSTAPNRQLPAIRYIALRAALEFRAWLGEEAVIAHNTKLAADGCALLAGGWRTHRIRDELQATLTHRCHTMLLLCSVASLRGAFTRALRASAPSGRAMRKEGCEEEPPPVTPSRPLLLQANLCNVETPCKAATATTPAGCDGAALYRRYGFYVPLYSRPGS